MIIEIIRAILKPQLGILNAIILNVTNAIAHSKSPNAHIYMLKKIANGFRILIDSDPQSDSVSVRA